MFARLSRAPLATTGGMPGMYMGKEATIFYCRLADLLSHKTNLLYSVTLAWIRYIHNMSR